MTNFNYQTPEQLLEAYKQHPVVSKWSLETFHTLSKLHMLRSKYKKGQILIDQNSFESLLTSVDHA